MMIECIRCIFVGGCCACVDIPNCCYLSCSFLSHILDVENGEGFILGESDYLISLKLAQRSETARQTIINSALFARLKLTTYWSFFSEEVKITRRIVSWNSYTFFFNKSSKSKATSLSLKFRSPNKTRLFSLQQKR